MVHVRCRHFAKKQSKSYYRCRSLRTGQGLWSESKAMRGRPITIWSQQRETPDHPKSDPSVVSQFLILPLRTWPYNCGRKYLRNSGNDCRLGHLEMSDNFLRSTHFLRTHSQVYLETLRGR